MKTISVCHVEVHGDPISEELENEYLERYQWIIDLVNMNLEGWNKMWERLYPDPMEEGTMPWDIYGQFISAQERNICISNNLDHLDSHLLMDSIPDKNKKKIIAIIDRDRNHWLEMVFEIGGQEEDE